MISAAIAIDTVDECHLLDFCKASGDQLRLQVLRILKAESLGVMELCRIFDTAQPAMSHHLKVLANADLVQTRKEGTSVFYRRTLINPADPLQTLKTSFFQAIDNLVIDQAIHQQIDAVHQARAAHSRDFFARNADRLKQNQELIATYDHYSENVHDMLEGYDRQCRVLEIGSGESPLLASLTEQFDQITVIDHSTEMLDKARRSVTTGKRARVKFLQGEPQDFDDLTVDLILLNMVLHHMSSPAAFFRVARQLLDDAGTLFIIDLTPHDQDWTREACGDLWLGFQPDDLDAWAREAQFSTGNSTYLGLKNGFQIQLRQFHAWPQPNQNSYQSHLRSN
jgi:ArsR family transcriptional regulator